MAHMNVERIAISDLSQDPANARVHPDRNLAAITASLRRFGQQTPIVIDKSNVVRKGNGTLQAAMAMGWDSIDCIRTELTSSDAIAYAIADNRTSELAEWDEDILAAQLQGLLTDDEALLEAAGFDEDELAAILDDGEGDGGSDPAKPKVTISPELHERQDYIVIVFDDAMDWIVATQRLGIKTVEASQVETSTIKKQGVGRVITASEFLKAIGYE
jgi:hypothetical protein